MPMSDSPRPDPFGDREPPRALGERIARTLRANDLVATQSPRYARDGLRAAALILAIAGAFWMGRLQRSTAVAEDPGPQFLVLLYEDSTYRDDRPVREIVAEYAGWADSLRRDRALVLGEKLGDAYNEIPVPLRQGVDHPTGLFIVRARDLRQATALAQTSPHLRYGGHLVVQAIDR
jgi:hypothetical protein